MITRLEDFRAYNLALELGNEIWDIVGKRGYFEKDTVGKQLVKAVDSIAANLSEGLGRYHFKDIKNLDTIRVAHSLKLKHGLRCVCIDNC
jgi:four helix bundle protein